MKTIDHEVNINYWSAESDDEIVDMSENEVNQSELQIWSLQISSLERISARKWVLIFLEHYQSTEHC